mmetsp:Transcript_77877/g.241371  ORF Transcript_77877/g.241371 Transcript_77877/m.241371 type:complete len:453 (+) Transcript_77877:68-1426(+)|eukprot:CAMPEP_0204566362 /NCGR_PEP_ID=MMETSP0661-20131031/36006_1 /ASSEMBLY_ACC=CAM_ASM_000606 /TAXON_ID=109239 /ORGANISM="Alexandrium margalefi, Strain AMGDE01CS-322" /LENGTH=452 /DNA_ID=CAMNT_0051574203 /DNA_START=68 /DNA_END=1426 /DNA_ORIENTATION=-
MIDVCMLARLALGGVVLLARASALRIPDVGDAERLGGTSPNILFAARPGQVPELRAPCDIFKLYHQPGPYTTLKRFMPEAEGAKANLVIGVVTNRNMHATRAHPHFAYHSKHLTTDTMLMYFTNGHLAERAIAPHDDTGVDGYGAAIHRYLTAWHYVAAGCHGLDYRWYLQIDDDTAVSVPRLGMFLFALGTRLGDPYTKNTLVGRMVTWHNTSMCGELFGGNGILATRKAMQEFNALEAGKWDDAHRKVIYGDAQLSELAHAAKCSMVQMHAPFGLGTWDRADEMPHGLIQLRARWANVTVSLHKVKTPDRYEWAEHVFALPGVEIGDYAALLDEVQWMFDRRCVTTSVRQHHGTDDLQSKTSGKHKPAAKDRGQGEGTGNSPPVAEGKGRARTPLAEDKKRGHDESRTQPALLGKSHDQRAQGQNKGERHFAGKDKVVGSGGHSGVAQGA